MEILARSIGRRKEAVATLKMVKGTGKFFINNKIASEYLHNNSNNLLSIQSPLEILHKFSNLENSEISYIPPLEVEAVSNNSTNSNNEMHLPSNLDIIVKVQGGGLVGQAEAIKLAVARAVCVFIQNSTGITTELPEILKKNLKDKGYLTQDARVKERRKYGLKKARKAPQYNKR